MLASIVGFAAPDCQDDVAGYAEFLLDARERVVILTCELLTARGETIEGQLAQILCRRLHEFRLLRLLLGTAGNSEVWQRVIGLQPARRTVERGAGDAERLRLRPHHLQPLLERRVDCLRGRREQEDRN